MTSPPADPERRQVAAWVVALFAVAFHIWGLYTPSVPDAGALAFPGLDKLAHVVLFAVPTWALLRVTRTPWVPLLLMLAHMPVSELVQSSWLPGRTGDVGDAAADLVGIAVGWWTFRSSARVEGNSGESSPSGAEGP